MEEVKEKSSILDRIVVKMCRLQTLCKEAILFLCLDKVLLDPEDEEDWKKISFRTSYDLEEVFLLSGVKDIVILTIRPVIDQQNGLASLSMYSSLFSHKELNQIQQNTLKGRLEWAGKTWDISNGCKNKVEIKES